MAWRLRFLLPGSRRCRRLAFQSHTHTSRMRMMATALPATSISRMVLARLATCCNYKPTIRRSRNFSTGWKRMELTRATRCSCSPLTKATTSDTPTPAGCDGVTTPCTYNHVGEINADLRRMVYTQSGDSTLFSVHSDDAPTVYVNGTSAQPIRDQDPLVRNLEREMSQLSWLNPYTGVVEYKIMVTLAVYIGMITF